EPLTDGRRAVIRDAGAGAMSGYSVAEGGLIGHACAAPEAADEVHLLHDCHALIQSRPGEETGTVPSGALLLSTIRPMAPLILINVSVGDLAVMSERACGCPLERAGWKTHLHTIRSYEKLTAGGMT